MRHSPTDADTRTLNCLCIRSALYVDEATTYENSKVRQPTPPGSGPRLTCCLSGSSLTRLVPRQRNPLLRGSLDGQSAISEIPRVGGDLRQGAVDGERTLGRFWFDTDEERLIFTQFEAWKADIWVVVLRGEP